MALWLAGALRPGDHVVARIRAGHGPKARWDLVPFPVIAAGMIGAWHDFFSGPLLSDSVQALLALLGVGCSVFSLALARKRKSVYVAITGEQVVAVEMR